MADKASLADLQMHNPLGGGRMHAAVNALCLMKERVGGEKAIMGCEIVDLNYFTSVEAARQAKGPQQIRCK